MTAINVQDAPRVDITIAGVVLTVPQPYTEGHVLRANEASVLNQTYAENIRNNFAGAVKKMKEEQGEALDTTALQDALNTYLDSYDFGVRQAGTRSIPIDPVQREALRMAGDAIKKALKAKGASVKSIGQERFDELCEQLVQSRPDLLERAKQIVALKSGIGAEVEL